MSQAFFQRTKIYTWTRVLTARGYEKRRLSCFLDSYRPEDMEDCCRARFAPITCGSHPPSKPYSWRQIFRTIRTGYMSSIPCHNLTRTKMYCKEGTTWEGCSICDFPIRVGASRFDNVQRNFLAPSYRGLSPLKNQSICFIFLRLPNFPHPNIPCSLASIF